MEPLKFGIVGPGAIAAVVADAIEKSKNTRLTAVASRSIENARAFVVKRDGVLPVQGIDALLPHIDAVYIATPTVAKEEIALVAIAAGKHVLVDKPFASRESVVRMIKAAADKGVVFMDATHFVHHPRTAAVKTTDQIGAPRSLHTAFYFPISDSATNIRFNPDLEPMTALGDMAWYSMRAVVEYLRPTGRVTKATTIAERDHNKAIIRASGVIAFESGEISTFDVGYTAGTVVMDLLLLGTTGIIEMDDFVLDWNASFPFRKSDIAIGYSHRTGMATRKEATFVPTPTATAQEVTMMEDFAELVVSGDNVKRTAYAEASIKTQEYLDAIWMAANS